MLGCIMTGFADRLAKWLTHKDALNDELIMRLKNNFKHIHGMWPKTAKFESEQERMESWQTTSVIK